MHDKPDTLPVYLPTTEHAYVVGITYTPRAPNTIARQQTNHLGIRYPPLRLNIAQKICLYSIPTSISTRITYSVRVTHDGFPLGSIWRPERLIILCTRDTRNICPNIIRDVRRPYTSFCFYRTFVRTGLTERKCLTTYWNEAIYPTCSMGSYEYTWLDRIL